MTGYERCILKKNFRITKNEKMSKDILGKQMKTRDHHLYDKQSRIHASKRKEWRSKEGNERKKRNGGTKEKEKERKEGSKEGGDGEGRKVGRKEGRRETLKKPRKSLWSAKHKNQNTGSTNNIYVNKRALTFTEDHGEFER